MGAILKSSLRLSTTPEEQVVTNLLVPGQDEFVNEDIKNEYTNRLQSIHDEMVIIPGLREVTKMALERATFLYYKMRDLEKSGALTPGKAGSMKTLVGLYEKILSGWIKTNEELFKAARQIDVETAFKQSFLGQVVAVLRKHISDPDLLKNMSDDLATLS